mgnify:CR=1 FL=1
MCNVALVITTGTCCATTQNVIKQIMDNIYIFFMILLLIFNFNLINNPAYNQTDLRIRTIYFLLQRQELPVRRHFFLQSFLQ